MAGLQHLPSGSIFKFEGMSLSVLVVEIGVATAMGTVFISYSHTDSGIADAIVKELGTLGIEHFRDVKNIKWGHAISATVRDGLHAASALIVIVSPGSLESQWVAYEVGFGTGTGKRILPFMTDPSLKVPGFMSDLLHVDSIERIRDFFTENPEWHKASPASEIKIHGKESPAVNFTDNQMGILRAASRPQSNGVISRFPSFGASRDKHRDETIDHFVSLGLLQDAGDDRFRLTLKGWDLVDQFWVLAIVDATGVSIPTKEIELAARFQLTNDQADRDELRRHLSEMENKGLVAITTENGGRLVTLTKEGLAHKKRRPISLS